eukprot:TRINITY_DN2488_c0_g2_i9.p1 TRINITY_DN2488_c0_g2~~TRINITY_DN2488_c0_g2_i9.p1  ORF type:complete len:308 (-),score=44.42 TRINITY_DN2488_c0_g2_i9:373-1296(-)
MCELLQRKLLIIDLNGLLVDTFREGEQRKRPAKPADLKVKRKFVYKRPYCEDFLKYCFENFDVAIWSSAMKPNVDPIVSLVLGDSRNKLCFCWYQSECTQTGFIVPGHDRKKPLVLKELSRLWDKGRPDVPWEKGKYGPANTLLIDDSPYKALHNPPYTAIFPEPYDAHFSSRDNVLGGSLRSYLGGLLIALDVQDYVREHPYGQSAINEYSLHWPIYSQIVCNMLQNNNSTEHCTETTAPAPRTASASTTIDEILLKTSTESEICSSLPTKKKCKSFFPTKFFLQTLRRARKKKKMQHRSHLVHNT